MSRTRVALISGITGQDRYYLSRLLLQEGYDVHGMVRRSSVINRVRINQLKAERQDHTDRITMHYGDLTDNASIRHRVLKLEPDEIYNLGAQSHVRVSFDKPMYTRQVNAEGALNVLKAARVESDKCRFASIRHRPVKGSAGCRTPFRRPTTLPIPAVLPHVALTACCF